MYDNRAHTSLRMEGKERERKWTVHQRNCSKKKMEIENKKGSMGIEEIRSIELHFNSEYIVPDHHLILSLSPFVLVHKYIQVYT